MDGDFDDTELENHTEGSPVVDGISSNGSEPVVDSNFDMVTREMPNANATLLSMINQKIKKSPDSRQLQDDQVPSTSTLGEKTFGVVTSAIEHVDAAPETSTPQPRMIPCIKVTNGARGRYIVKTFSGGSNQNGVPVVKIPANNKIGVRYTAKGDPPNLTLADVLPQLQTRRSIIPSQEQTIRVVKRNVSPSDIILVGSNTTYVNKPLVIRKITPATPAETKQVTATRPVIRSITRQAPSQNQGPSLSKSGTGSFIPPSKLTEQAEKEIKKEPLAGGNEFDFEESFTPRASTSTTSHPRRSPSPCFDQSVGRRPLPQIIREIEKPSEIRVLRRQLRIKPLERNSNSNESTARFQPYPHIMPGGKFVTRKIRVFQSNDQATGPKLNFTELLRGHITPSQKSSSTSNSNPNHQPPECSSSASFTPVPNSISNVQIVGAQEYGKKLMTNFVDKNDGTVEHWLVVERVVNSLDEVQGHSTIEKQAMLEVIINTLCSKGNYSVNARAQDMRLNGIYDEPKVAVMNKIVHTIRRSFTSNIQCNILGRVRLPTTDDPIPQIYVVRSPLKQSHYLIIHFIEKCIWELELMGNQECVFKFERLINAMYELIVAIWDIDVVVKKYALRGDPAFCLLYNTLFDIKSPRGKLQAVLQECDPEVAQEFATKPFRLVPNYRLVKDKFPVCKQQTPFVTAIASLIKMRLGQQVNRSLFRIVKHHGTKGYFTKLFSELLTYFRLDKNGQGVMSIACTEHLLEHKLISQIAMEHQLDFVKLELVLGLVGKFVLDIQKTNPESSNYTLRIYEIRSEYTFQNAHTGFLDSPIASQLCQNMTSSLEDEPVSIVLPSKAASVPATNNLVFRQRALIPKLPAAAYKTYAGKAHRDKILPRHLVQTFVKDGETIVRFMKQPSTSKYSQPAPVSVHSKGGQTTAIENLPQKRYRISGSNEFRIVKRANSRVTQPNSKTQPDPLFVSKELKGEIKEEIKQEPLDE